MTRVIVSIPDGMCSKEMLLSSRTERSFRAKPISEFIIAFSMLIAQKSFLPLTPVMMKRGFFNVFCTMSVP